MFLFGYLINNVTNDVTKNYKTEQPRSKCAEMKRKGTY